ncbi:MAG: hypothetical protein VKN33_06245, partial [Candidatus Sericytochromatia bacterium]|nr:hypothetical protein [Candidatus Sericytochromatia bacterium]
MLRFAFVTPVAIALPLPAERATPPLNASVAGEKISPVAGKGEPRNAPLDFQRALKREMEALGSQAQRAPSGQVQPLMILGAPEEELALPHRAPLFALLETGGDLVEEAGASRPPEAGEPFSDSIPQ